MAEPHYMAQRVAGFQLVSVSHQVCGNLYFLLLLRDYFKAHRFI